MENNLILPALILIPFIAGFVCWLVDKLDQQLPRWIALIGMLITLGLTIALWQHGTYHYELGEKHQHGHLSFIFLGLKPSVSAFIWQWMVYRCLWWV